MVPGIKVAGQSRANDELSWYDRTMAVKFREIQNEVRACVKDAGRGEDAVALMAVSKTVDVDAVEEAYAQGARDFGENRPDELVRKATYFKEKGGYDDIRWHFIGNIQSRQIKNIVPYAYMIHSVDKLEHVQKIDKVAFELGKIQKILLEVNVSGEESKSGVGANEVPGFLRKIGDLENVEVLGLMTMAPIQDEAHKNLPKPRVVFRGARDLLEQNRDLFGARDPKNGLQLSAGMTNDWQDAIFEGSTIVRLGRAIFTS